MRSTKTTTRRRFLAGCAALAAGGAVAPRVLRGGVLAAPGRPGPNDRIGVGVIGVGRRGRALMGLPPQGRVVAVSDVDRSRAEEAAGTAKCGLHADYRKLLDSKDVDAVIVATPDHWHALTSIHACQASKDVYCEKPLGMTIREGRAIVEAARRHGRVFQVGVQRRSFRDHRIGCALVREGKIGEVLTVLGPNYPSPWECRFPGQPVPDGLDWDAWCGPTDPVPYHSDIFIQRSNPGWISLRPYSGGEMTGTGAHGIDLVQWALGTDETGPVEVWAEGGKLERLEYTVPESRARGDAYSSDGHAVTFRYASGVLLKLTDGALGGTYIGEHGKLMIESGGIRSEPAEIAEEALRRSGEPPSAGTAHLKNWLDCMRSREKPAADVEVGHLSTAVCHLGNIARWVGRKLRWDPEKEVFPGDDEANSYLARPSRKPYGLPRPS